MNWLRNLLGQRKKTMSNRGGLEPDQNVESLINLLDDAIDKGDVKLAQELVTANPTLLHRKDTSRHETTPLHGAVGHRANAIVQLFLSKGADPNAKTDAGLSPLHYAAMEQDPRLTELLIASGADVTAQTKDGRTPMHTAIYRGSVEVLFANGADINLRDKVGRTPLHAASDHDNVEVVEFLLTHGAQINARDNLGQTPLHWAAGWNWGTSIKL